MATIASKNLYELLGNDADQDPDRAPPAPVKVVDKPVQRTGKRNAAGADPTIDPLRPSAGRGGARDGVNNREQGDRPARNREPREYRGGEGRGEGRGRGRGRGRGGRGGAPRDDRHSHTGINEHEKQAAHGWGAETGTAEWADEKAGEAIATAEANNDSGFTPDTSSADPAFTNGPGAAGEAVNDEAVAEEDNTKSYDQYLAEQAEKRLAISQTLSVRKPNEGSKQQFPEGKAFSRESEDFIAAAAGKARKAKEAQDKKERLTLDGQYYQAADSGDRGGRGGRGGGRGGARGGRGGEFRGERGGRGGRGRGEPRGGARGDRGDSRPERGGARGGFNATDESAFPALGRS